MFITRKERTTFLRKQVEDEWNTKFWTFIEENDDKPWDWNSLSKNPNITLDSVLSHPDKPWNWVLLSLNPNITFDIVHCHPDKH